MRNLLTHAIASLGLATLLVGSASAADTYPSNTMRQATGNIALQDTLERDDTTHRLRQSPVGVIVSGSGNMAQNAAGDSAASLDRQAAETSSYRDE